jgi:hypothetical protein
LLIVFECLPAKLRQSSSAQFEFAEAIPDYAKTCSRLGDFFYQIVLWARARGPDSLVFLFVIGGVEREWRFVGSLNYSKHSLSLKCRADEVVFDTTF